MYNSQTKSHYRTFVFVAVLIGVVSLISVPSSFAQSKKGPITEEQVNAAQQAWCDGLVKIGKVHKKGGDYKAVASQLIDDL